MELGAETAVRDRVAVSPPPARAGKPSRPESREKADLRTRLTRPLTIRGRVLESRLVLAPLSKLGNVAFRELVAEYGGYGLLFSEMTGSRSVPHGRSHLENGYVWRDEELPRLVCQLYGSEPEEIAEAARHVAAAGFFGVDLNFGCAVASVCKHGCGANILKDPDLAGRIVAAVRRAVDGPLFVKYRTGWRDDPEAAADFARRFEDAGADALTFHPRVAPDRRTRPPRWDYIGRVVEAVSIPVFGNGNVFDAGDCARMLDGTGCAGVALGRLAVARPWIFAEWTGGADFDGREYGRCALRLLDLLEHHFAPTTALRRFYKFAPYFAANFRFGHAFLSTIHKAKTLEALRETLEKFFSVEPDIVGRLNPGLFR
ncbi:MAG: tRNA dihydrouridine synthase [Desulfococcaceae bacterium]